MGVDMTDTTQTTTSRKMLLTLHNKIDSLVQRGANSNGHLEYVLKELNEIIARMDDEQEI